MAGMNSTEISTWIRERIARELGSEASAIDPEVTFDRIGPDSLPLLGVLGDLALELDIEIETSVLFDHPTISGLATHLAGS